MLVLRVEYINNDDMTLTAIGPLPANVPQIARVFPMSNPCTLNSGTLGLSELSPGPFEDHQTNILSIRPLLFLWDHSPAIVRLSHSSTLPPRATQIHIFEARLQIN
jgi:hypothetical protein